MLVVWFPDLSQAASTSGARHMPSLSGLTPSHGILSVNLGLKIWRCLRAQNSEVTQPLLAPCLPQASLLILLKSSSALEQTHQGTVVSWTTLGVTPLLSTKLTFERF